jgi:RNA-binding protein Musashi
MSYYGHGGGGTTPTASSSQPPPQSPQQGGIDQGKIFVGGLSWSTTEESLRFHFEQYGPVESVQVMRDRNTGEPRGFGFVIFKDGATVDLVMKDVPNGHEINHKLVDVKRAQARGVAPPSIHRDEPESGGGAPVGAAGGDFHNTHHNKDSEQEHHLTPEELNTKVFVGGIPPNIDSAGLKEIFEEFGPVVDAIVMVDQVTNRSRCFGFVTFENGSQGAQKAIAQQPLNIEGRSVEVKLATPKAEQRRAPPAAGPKHVGLRAGIASSSSGEYAGLAVAYGRSGWKAGYGTYAFGKAGWGVQGWEDLNVNKLPERAGFSFDMLAELPREVDQNYNGNNSPPPSKRARH